MPNITIFEGSNREFIELVKEESTSTLSLKTLVIILDKGNFEEWYREEVDKGNKYTFIGHTNDFSAVTESFLDTFPDLIFFLIDHGILENVYIQNPVIKVKDRFEQLEKYSKIDFKILNGKIQSIDNSSLKSFYEEFNETIIGQEHVVEDLLSYIYPHTTSYKKPIVLMFYGPPGVGKTETAKLLGKALFKGEIVREQMSMYQTEAFANYLFGGKPHENSFAKNLMSRESNIVLLDEFDKCPIGYLSAFYQLFDEGIFIDKNYKVAIGKSIIICTTNYESKVEILKAVGSPIYSRFDGFISFEPLSIEAREKIINIKYEKNLKLWSIPDKKIIEASALKEELLIKAGSFSNVRNIDNTVRSFMSQILVKNNIISKSEKCKDE